MARGTAAAAAHPVSTIDIDRQLQSGQLQQLKSSPKNNINGPPPSVVHHNGSTSGPALAVGGIGRGGCSEIIQQSPPAFPGAKYDVNGYCVRHSKVRLCQPIFAEDAKNGADPIKYKTLRKICSQCGAQPVQNTKRLRVNRLSGSDGSKQIIKRSSSDSDGSSKQIVNKVVMPRRNTSSGNNSDSAAPRSPIRKYGNKHPNNQSSAVALNSEEDKDKVRDNRKEGGKEKVRDRTKVRDKDGKKDRNATKKSSSRAASVDNKKNVKHNRVGSVKDSNAQQSGVTTRGRQRRASVDNEMDVTAVDNEKDVKHSRGSPVKDSNAQQSITTRGRQRHTTRHHAPDPEESHGGDYTKNKPDPEEEVLSEEGKKHPDDIPLTHSPNVPKYTVKFSRGGSQPPMGAPPYSRIDGEGGDTEQESEERATGVFMMAAGLSLHNNDDTKRESDGGNEERPSKVTIEKNDEKKKEKRRVSAKEQGRSSVTNSSTEGEHQSKKPHNEDVVRKLWEGRDLDTKGGLSRKSSSNNKESGKVDFSHLWESHACVNNESSPHHDNNINNKNKHDSKGPSGTKKEGLGKKVFHRRTKQSKDRPLRGSMTDNDPMSKRTTDKSSSGMDQSKVSSSHGNNNTASRHHGGGVKSSSKADNGVKKKECHGSSNNNTANHRPTTGAAARAGGRSNHDDFKVRFRRVRSHSPSRRKKGENHRHSNDKANNDKTRKQQQQHYQRSKSLPQKNSQRKRVSATHHVHEHPKHSSQLSSYRQVFLEEMGQMSAMKSISIPAPTAAVKTAESTKPTTSGV